VSHGTCRAHIACEYFKEFTMTLSRIIDAIRYRFKRPVRVTFSKYADISCWIDLINGTTVKINGVAYEILGKDEEFIRVVEAVGEDASDQANLRDRQKEEPTLIRWTDVRALHIL
jgi:hypothetical protein